MIVRWYEGKDPWFDDFNTVRRELDRLFDIGLPLSNIRSVPRGTFPAVNLFEGKDEVTVQAYIPGVDPKKLEVVFQDNALTISGERYTHRPGGSDIPAERFHRRERASGPFTRVVSLPDGLDPDKVTASCRDGILNISIAKHEAQKPKQINVAVA